MIIGNRHTFQSNSSPPNHSSSAHTCSTVVVFSNPVIAAAAPTSSCRRSSHSPCRSPYHSPHHSPPHSPSYSPAAASLIVASSPFSNAPRLSLQHLRKHNKISAVATSNQLNGRRRLGRNQQNCCCHGNTTSHLLSAPPHQQKAHPHICIPTNPDMTTSTTIFSESRSVSSLPSSPAPSYSVSSSSPTSPASSASPRSFNESSSLTASSFDGSRPVLTNNINISNNDKENKNNNENVAANIRHTIKADMRCAITQKNVDDSVMSRSAHKQEAEQMWSKSAPLHPLVMHGGCAKETPHSAPLIVTATTTDLPIHLPTTRHGVMMQRNDHLLSAATVQRKPYFVYFESKRQNDVTYFIMSLIVMIFVNALFGALALLCSIKSRNLLFQSEVSNSATCSVASSFSSASSCSSAHSSHSGKSRSVTTLKSKQGGKRKGDDVKSLASLVQMPSSIIKLDRARFRTARRLGHLAFLLNSLGIISTMTGLITVFMLVKEKKPLVVSASHSASE